MKKKDSPESRREASLAEPKRVVLERLHKNLAELKRRKKFNALEFYKPYPKQQEFHDLSMTKLERLLRAGTQLGKTEAGAFEMAYHLTGLYPDWWLGRRWDRPIKAWAAGITGIQTRDVIQKKLFGDLGQLGAGSIPKDCLKRDDITLARGISDLYDTALIKHVSGGMSQIRLKTYEQGREKFQGDTLDLIWFDEEPPLDVYLEALARLTTTDGMAYITFTPLKGDTDVVLRFTGPDVPESRGEVVMVYTDAAHMTPERIKAALERYPADQHDARLRGEPFQGSGRVFAAPEETITVDDFPLPAHWYRLWGIDFGIFHPFAAVLIGWDKDADCIYVVKCLRMKDKLPIDHAAAMLPYGKEIPVAWPQDGAQRKEFEGQLISTAEIYRRHGLKMQHEHARFPDGSNSTEAGITEMQERIRSGRFKVFRSCAEWFGEYRGYHRDEHGVLVKLRDDLMSATRVAVMARRGARRDELRVAPQYASTAKICAGVDDDHFGL